MRLQIWLFFLGAFFCTALSANPIVSIIYNNSDIGYAVVIHSDKSGCSLQNKDVVIDAQSEFKSDFLVERGNPSVLLRPLYFLDPETGQKYYFLDELFQIIPKQLEQAFLAWKQGKGKVWRKIKTPNQWLAEWVGGDIQVVPYEVEMTGYLKDVSRIRVFNSITTKQSWFSFSKGIFSALVLELIIDQIKKRPIKVSFKVLHGEGGVCTDSGLVKRL